MYIVCGTISCILPETKGNLPGTVVFPTNFLEHAANKVKLSTFAVTCSIFAACRRGPSSASYHIVLLDSVAMYLLTLNASCTCVRRRFVIRFVVCSR